MKQYNNLSIIDWKHKDFEDFINENSSLFYAFTYRYIKDRHIIEDILQVCYIKMWSNKSKISAMESPFNYIFTMIKNNALNYIRDNKRISVGLDEINNNINDTTDFYKNIFDAECSKAIADAICELSPQSQKVINLILEGYTMNEIADQLNITINSVKTIKYRAIDKLAKSIPGKLIGFVYFIIHCQ